MTLRRIYTNTTPLHVLVYACNAHTITAYSNMVEGCPSPLHVQLEPRAFLTTLPTKPPSHLPGWHGWHVQMLRFLFFVPVSLPLLSSFFFSFSSLLRPSFCTAPRFVHLCSPRLRSLLQKHPFLLLFAPLFVSGQNV